MLNEKHRNEPPAAANDKTRIHVRRKDLPLHCPMSNSSHWSSHPKVFLPIEKTGREKCPYCGTDYILSD